jgi:hypothetical protein
MAPQSFLSNSHTSAWNLLWFAWQRESAVTLKDGPCVDRMVHFVRAPVFTTLCNKYFLMLRNELFQCLVPSEIQVPPGVRHGFLELFAEPPLPPGLCLLRIEYRCLQGWSSVFDSSASPQHHVLVCYIHNPFRYCRPGSK